MRKRSLTLCFCVIILISIIAGQKTYSQKVIDKEGESSIKNYKEEIYIRTDRDIYIAGEKVWFKVYKMDGVTGSAGDISRVVYVELLDNKGLPLRQLKVNTEAQSGSSVFTLPENMSSDNYVIRAYTSWMQNFSTDFFCYRNISVINPFETIDHLNLPSDARLADTLQVSADGQSEVIIDKEEGNQLEEKSFFTSGNESIIYTITLQKPVYSKREKVTIEISAKDQAGNPVETDMSVSVTKSVAFSQNGINGFLRKDITGLKESVPDHLAEIEGHLLSGFIRSKTTGEPLKKIDISLSYVGKTARCQFGRTDENGEFNFVIKESGMNEIVIQPLSDDNPGYYVELNQPFCNTFSKYSPAPFYLDSSKIDEINNVIVAMQINNIYEPFRQIRKEVPETFIPDFFGKPENTILMSDYIELTSIREVVKEIIPNVYTLKQNGKYDFKLINKFRGQPFENKPLVLVDGVPIYDFEKVLSINSKEIEKADVINTRYFYSENVFDGIVSFITKKGNLSTMEFDNSIFRQVYEGCQVQNDFYSPDYNTDQVKNDRIPDFRNTLFWSPGLRTMKDGKAETEFFTSDETAEYTIVVEGVTTDGKSGFSTTTLHVK